MSQVPHPTTTASSSSAAGSNEGELANLAQLHRMSRTAGLGSSEYTAVNNTAVVAAILGIASSLSLFTPVFLFLPVVGVVISVIAIRQIRSSNRTQTGMVLALLGLIGSVAFAGFTGLQAYERDRARKTDEAQMVLLTSEFGQKLVAKDYKGAYDLMDARFQEQVKMDRFSKFFDEVIPAQYGPVTGVESNKLFDIQEDPSEPSIRLATSRAKIKAEKFQEGFPTEIRYRRTGDRWVIFGLPELFQPPQPAGGAGAGGAGGAMPQGPAGPPSP